MKMKTKVKSPDKGSLLFGRHRCEMNSQALMYITSVLGEYPERPYDKTWPENEKAEITFSHGAIEEILNLVWDHPQTLASETIANFAVTLQFYAATAATSKQQRIFSIAAETAWDLLEKIEEVEK